MLTLTKFNFCLKRKIPTILVGIFALALLVSAQQSYVQVLDQRRTLLPPPAMLDHMTFGYSEVIADSMWIRALQDFDYCEAEISKRICVNNSWLYRMLDSITNLSPHFRMPYATGGLALSVLVSDIEGAAKFFDKGAKAFPNDWPILYRAAYHYMYEVKDNKRAAELLIQAGKNGAPPWVFTLAGRLYSDAGNLELAESVLQDMIQTKQDPVLIKRLQDKIQSLKKNQ